MSKEEEKEIFKSRVALEALQIPSVQRELNYDDDSEFQTPEGQDALDALEDHKIGVKQLSSITEDDVEYPSRRSQLTSGRDKPS